MDVSRKWVYSRGFFMWKFGSNKDLSPVNNLVFFKIYLLNGGILTKKVRGVRNMSFFLKLKRLQQSQKENKKIFLGADFDVRMEWFKETFQQSIDITFHELIASQTRCGIVFLQCMVDQQLFDDQVLKYIVSPNFASSGNELIHKLLDLQSISTMCTSILTEMQENISWGHTRVIVISEDMAKEGITDVLEFVVHS